MSKEDLIAFFLENQELFGTNNNIFLYFIRSTMWAILTGLAALLHKTEELFNTLLENLSLFEYQGIQEFLNDLQPITKVLIVLGILLIAYLLLFQRLKERSQILVNVCALVVIMAGLPLFVGTFAEVASSGQDIYSEPESSSIAIQLLNNSVTDLLYLDSKDFSDAAIEKQHNFPDGAVLRIQPQEIIYPKKTQNQDYFSYILTTNFSGEYTLEKVDQPGLLDLRLDIMFPYYYRYDIDWLSLMIGLPALLFAILYSCFKVVKILYQIVFCEIILTMTSAVDLANGQRMKKVVSEMIGSFLVIVAMALSFKLYTIALQWATDTFTGLLSVIVILGLSAAMIDGPNIVQKLVGIDAGLKSFGQVLQNAYYASQMAHSTASTLHKAGSKAMDVAGSGIAYGIGKTRGVLDALKEEQGNDSGIQQNSHPSSQAAGIESQVDSESQAQLGGEVSEDPASAQQDNFENTEQNTNDSNTFTQANNSSQANTSTEEQSFQNQNGVYQQMSSEQESRQGQQTPASESAEQDRKQPPGSEQDSKSPDQKVSKEAEQTKQQDPSLRGDGRTIKDVAQDGVANNPHLNKFRQAHNIGYNTAWKNEKDRIAYRANPSAPNQPGASHASAPQPSSARKDSHTSAPGTSRNAAMPSQKSEHQHQLPEMQTESFFSRFKRKKENDK